MPLLSSTAKVDVSPQDNLVKALLLRGVDPKTVDKYTREWKITEAEAFGGTAWPAPKGVKNLMKVYIDTLRDRGVAVSTIRRRLLAANRFYEAQGAPRTLKGVRSPRGPENRTPTLSGDEAKKLLDQLGSSHRDLRDACELILVTGMRLSEILNLKYSLTDLRAHRVVVNGRIVALGGRARDILRRRLFAHDTWHKKQQWYTDGLKQAAEAAGIPQARLMMLRNTFAVQTLATGRSLRFVLAQLGVKSETMMRAISAAYLDYEP